MMVAIACFIVKHAVKTERTRLAAALLQDFAVFWIFFFFIFALLSDMKTMKGITNLIVGVFAGIMLAVQMMSAADVREKIKKLDRPKDI